MPRLITASRFFAWFVLLGASIAMLVASGFYLYLRPGLPPVHQLMDMRLQTPLRVYTSDSKLIAEFGEKRRTPVTIEQVPDMQLKAFLAAEDARFYEHFGVDIKGLARATIELVTTGEIQSGGSTITMQVAKNYFLTSLPGNSMKYCCHSRSSASWTKTRFSSCTSTRSTWATAPMAWRPRHRSTTTSL